MIRLLWVALLAVASPSTTSAAGAAGKVNVLTREVRAIRASGDQSDPALLLVYVTDHAGSPLDGIELSLTEGSRSRGRATTTREGTALLRLTMTGHLTVRAAHVGFVTAEARRVFVQMGGFTAVALPLEVADGADPITSRDSMPGRAVERADEIHQAGDLQGGRRLRGSSAAFDPSLAPGAGRKNP